MLGVRTPGVRLGAQRCHVVGQGGGLRASMLKVGMLAVHMQNPIPSVTIRG